MSDVERVDLSHEDGGAGGSSEGADSPAWPRHPVDLNGEPVHEPEVGRPTTSPAGPNPPGRQRLCPVTVVTLWLATVGCLLFAIAVSQLQQLSQVRELSIAGMSLAMGAVARLLGAYLKGTRQYPPPS